MKNFVLALACIAFVGISILGQSNRGTRPRVAVTPTPQPRVIETDEDRREAGRPPVLIGGEDRGTTVPGVPDSADEEGGVVKIETNLVTIPVSVLDRDGRFISGLQQRDFRIFENGIEQKVEFFQSVEQPFTVVLMLDVSPSTAFQIDQIHRAAIAFVDQLRPQDRVMVIAFDERVRVLTQPTSNRSMLYSAIRQSQIGNGTSLYEAVDRAVKRELGRIPGRKAIVLFTDGVDTTSRRASYESNIRDVEESDVLIYPIRYDTQRDGFGGGGGGGISYPRGRTGRGGWGDIVGIILGGQMPTVRTGRGGAGTSSQEYETGKRYLEELAQNSGGRHFEADSLQNLDAAFSGIAEELRRQYSLGYHPENVGNRGDRKQIRVRVMRPNVVVRARTSYIVGQHESRFAGNQR
jgi:VWFA-related protein